MKLYREVTTRDIKEGCEFYNAKKRKRAGMMAVNPDEAESIYLLPIKITEGSILEVIEANATGPDYSDWELVAKAIVDKLKYG